LRGVRSRVRVHAVMEKSDRSGHLGSHGEAERQMNSTRLQFGHHDTRRLRREWLCTPIISPKLDWHSHAFHSAWMQALPRLHTCRTGNPKPNIDWPLYPRRTRSAARFENNRTVWGHYSTCIASLSDISLHRNPASTRQRSTFISYHIATAGPMKKLANGKWHAVPAVSSDSRQQGVSNNRNDKRATGFM
jgi:hypothetical protein